MNENKKTEMDRHRDLTDEIVSNLIIVGTKTPLYKLLLQLGRCNMQMLEYELNTSKLLLKMHYELDTWARRN